MNQDMPPSDVMIDLIKVSKTYPPDIQALVDISLAVRRQEIVFLTGRSGAGKSTLLRLISRIERADKGMVEVAGIDVAKMAPKNIHLLRRKVGMAYQDFKLLPERTVAENIAISMEVVYRSGSFIEKRTRDLLALLDLSQKHDTPAEELSRGEQQRVSIARAVANNPDIILADEPSGNLDSENTGRVMELFHQQNRGGATIVIATHDKSLYLNSAFRVIELRYGRLQSHQQNIPDSPAPEVETASSPAAMEA